MLYLISIILFFLLIWAIVNIENQEGVIQDLNLAVQCQIEEKHEAAELFTKKNSEKRLEIENIVSKFAELTVEYIALLKKYRTDGIELKNLRQDRQILDEVHEKTKNELQEAKRRLKEGAKLLLRG